MNCTSLSLASLSPHPSIVISHAIPQAPMKFVSLYPGRNETPWGAPIALTFAARPRVKGGRGRGRGRESEKEEGGGGGGGRREERGERGKQ
jgi:hypothetical protein